MAKKARKAPDLMDQSQPTNGDEPKKKRSEVETYDLLGVFVEGGHPGFPSDFRVVREDLNGTETILEVNKSDRTVKVVLPRRIAQVATKFTKNHQPNLRMTPKSMNGFVEDWLGWTDKVLMTRPAGVAFKSDPNFCFNRLPFDPIPCSDLKLCPAWKNYLDRMTNPDSFAMFMTRLFRRNADRVQALYLRGESGAGKTTISEFLKSLLKSCYYRAKTKSFENEFFLHMLVGKSVCVVDESNPAFVRSDEFLELTGTRAHTVQPKNRDHYTADLDFRFIFLANKPPEVTSQPEIMRRLIYCEIAAFDRATGLIDNIQAKLLEEFPRLLGYGLSLFAAKGLDPDASIIPSDDHAHEALAALADDSEGGAIEMFHRHFEQTEMTDGGAVCDDVKIVLREVERILDDSKLGAILDVWKRVFKIEKKRAKREKDAKGHELPRPWYYSKMRLKDRSSMQVGAFRREQDKRAARALISSTRH